MLYLSTSTILKDGIQTSGFSSNRSFERTGWETGVPADLFALKTFPPTINVYTTSFVYLQLDQNLKRSTKFWFMCIALLWPRSSNPNSFDFWVFILSMTKKKLPKDQECYWEERKDQFLFTSEPGLYPRTVEWNPKGFLADPSHNWSDGIMRDWGKTVTALVCIYIQYIST